MKKKYVVLLNVCLKCVDNKIYTKMSGLCHCRVPTDKTYGLDI